MENIFQFFNMGLMISIIIVTYAVFKILESFNISWKTWIKRIITIVISLLLSVFYYCILHLKLDEIIPTYLISVVLYDYLIKEILSKIKGGSEEKEIDA